MPARAFRNDPFTAFRFLVEIQGMIVGGFTEVTGLDMEMELEAYREGGVNAFIHQLPGAMRYPSHLVLKRGLTDADSFWRWYRDAANGDVARRNGSIILQNAKGDEVWRWNFVDAYPVRWTGPQLRASSAEIAIESLELAHRGLTKGK
ncbi:MAG TPA: phage tail protein [Vicinamibacterales bacterium]|nr:phage tail protein [Vicinamibacterales bacterium]